MVNPNPDLKSRNSQWSGVPNSTHKNTPDRLDKSRSALAEARLKIVEDIRSLQKL